MFSEHKTYRRMIFMLLFLGLGIFNSGLDLMAQNGRQSRPVQAKTSQESASTQTSHGYSNEKIKEATRAELLKMPRAEMKERLSSENFVITDLVNGSPSQLNDRNPGISYFTSSEFYHLSIELKMEAILNPFRYVFIESIDENPSKTINQQAQPNFRGGKRDADNTTGK